LRVWVTRTEPEAGATAARVAALGHEPVVAPVLEARAIAGAVLDLAGVDALAFTSAHAVAAFATLSTERTLAVFTVGAATAKHATAAGFTHVRSADGDVTALADLIATAKPALTLHPSAREPAADLAALLKARGVPARTITIYETVPTDLAAPPPEIDAVLVHSARAAARVAALLAGRDIAVFAISQAAAAPLRAAGLTRVTCAPFPNEAALLDLLR
jgi:uroporphyrinogen-III synthase